MNSCKGHYEDLNMLFGEAEAVEEYCGRKVPVYSLKPEYAEEMLALIFPQEGLKRPFEELGLTEQVDLLKVYQNDPYGLVPLDNDQISIATPAQMKKMYLPGNYIDEILSNWVSGFYVYDGQIIGISLSLKDTLFQPVDKEDFFLWLGGTARISYKAENMFTGESFNRAFTFTLVYPTYFVKD